MGNLLSLDVSIHQRWTHSRKSRRGFHVYRHLVASRFGPLRGLCTCCTELNLSCFHDGYSCEVENPMRRLGGSGARCINSRIASQTSANLSSCSASFSLRSRSLRANSWWLITASRRQANARTTYTRTAIALGELGAAAAIIVPCSVNAAGRTGENLSLRRWSQLVTTSAFFSGARRNMKSEGNRSRLRLIAWFKAFILTLYSAAKSVSRMTLCP